MLLTIQGLHLTVPTPAGPRPILRDVTLTVAEGETVGLVGESGSGKSTTSRAVLSLVPDGSRTSGTITVGEVGAGTAGGVRDIRMNRAAMIFQDPRSSLNPVRRIGDSATERLIRVHGMPKAEARARIVDLFAEVGLRDPEALLARYPHQLSGGMLQRVVIAAALSTDPELLLADEATSALDVTTQAEVLAMLRRLRAERKLGVLFITHDLHLASAYCDRVYVMKDGTVVDEQPAATVFVDPANPYTKALADATPRLSGADRIDRPKAEGTAEALRVTGLHKAYAGVTAVDDVSFAVPAGGAIGLVGESGSGKTTVARMIVGLTRPDSGVVTINGRDRTGRVRGRVARRERALEAQMVFQDPYGSLDRRLTVEGTLRDTLRRQHPRAGKVSIEGRISELLDRVGLAGTVRDSRPYQLSGGQRQRVAIARALAVDPAVLVLDEAVSALDVSVQAQILALLDDVRRDSYVSLVFVSHDLAVVAQVTDHVVLMYRGQAVEQGVTAEVLSHPRHAYTEMLLSSAPCPGWQPERVAELRRELP